VTVSLAVRFAVLKRDRFTCVYCGAHPPQVQIEVDHYFPAARGGTDDIGNLVTSCYECNHGKSASIVDRDGWPDRESPLWDWIEKGANGAKEYYKDQFLNRDDESFADIVERLWPEADF
jgi:5-methylcytosine-specific restriction endonuclease McrA